MISARVPNQLPSGGIANVASSVSIAATASTSPRNHASTYPSTISVSRSSPSVRSVACWDCSGVLSSIDLRARCSALLTDATVVPTVSATSAAENPSTSRRMSTARWFAGRCWRAATNASSTLSRNS